MNLESKTVSLNVNEDILYIDDDYVTDCSNKFLYHVRSGQLVKLELSSSIDNNEFFKLVTDNVEIYKFGSKDLYLVIGILGDYRVKKAPLLEKEIGYDSTTKKSYYKYLF